MDTYRVIPVTSGGELLSRVKAVIERKTPGRVLFPASSRKETSNSALDLASYSEEEAVSLILIAPVISRDADRSCAARSKK